MNGFKKYFYIGRLRNNLSGVVLFVTIVVIGVFFYRLNTLYPIYLDDWFYSFNMVDGQKIDSFSAIIESQYAHYFNWGGRVVLHAVAQALLWFGKSWADILNTLAYLALVYIIYQIANKGNKANPIVFIFINIFLWFALPSFSQNVLWKTGSANYLWGGVIFFSFIYFYVSYYIIPKPKRNKIKCISLFFLGILAGWTNENMALALVFLLLALILLLKYQKKEIPGWMMFGLAGTVIGCTVMLLSPGNAIRGSNDLWVAHQRRETDLSFYFYRFVTVSRLAYQYILVPCLVYVLLFVSHWWKGRGENKKQIIYLSLLFMCAAGIATVAMAGSPMFPERAWFGIVLLLMTGAMILYANIEFLVLVPRVINYGVFGVIFIIYIISCKENYNELEKFSHICENRDKMICVQREKGIQDIVINDYFFHQKQSSLIILDLQDWMMIDPGWDKRLGKYYGVDTIVFNELK